MRSKTMALVGLAQSLNKSGRSSSEPGAVATGSLLSAKTSWARVTRSLPLPVLIPGETKHFLYKAALFCALLLLPGLGIAQEDTRSGSPGGQPASAGRSHLVVSLADGGFVAFKSETAWAGTTRTSATAQAPQGEFRSQALVGEDHMIHRVLMDAAGKYIFGYDLQIQTVPASKKFNIAVKPLDKQIENKLLASSPDSQPARIATLPQSGEPQILNDGDSFALDLLVNQNTGVKIVDFVRVSFDRLNLWDDDPRTPPRDFTLDSVT